MDRRIIVCGGRDYDDDVIVQSVIASLNPENVTIITGGARGADRLAHEAAEMFGFKTEVYEANWDTFGKRAGVIRNKQMLDSEADLVIAFPGGKGTSHMRLIAAQHGVPVLKVIP